MSKKLYHERDVETLDDAGGFYFRHVMAMTSEQLHSKSDIAAELGYRDMIIDEFESKLLALKAERDALAVYCNELFRVLNQLNAQAERSLDFDIGNYHALKWASYAADNALDKTPHQHLAAHDAEVAENAVNDFCEWMLLSKRYSVAEWCGEYTKQLRAKVAK